MRSTRVPQQQALADQESSKEPEIKMEGQISSLKTGTGLLAEACVGSGGGGENEEDR